MLYDDFSVQQAVKLMANIHANEKWKQKHQQHRTTNEKKSITKKNNERSKFAQQLLKSFMKLLLPLVKIGARTKHENL